MEKKSYCKFLYAQALVKEIEFERIISSGPAPEEFTVWWHVNGHFKRVVRVNSASGGSAGHFAQPEEGRVTPEPLLSS